MACLALPRPVPLRRTSTSTSPLPIRDTAHSACGHSYAAVPVCAAIPPPSIEFLLFTCVRFSARTLVRPYQNRPGHTDSWIPLPLPNTSFLLTSSYLVMQLPSSQLTESV